MGEYTVRVRTETRWVHGEVPAGPITVAGDQVDASNPGRSHPIGSSGPLMFSV